jgi:hypothetical protein
LRTGMNSTQLWIEGTPPIDSRMWINMSEVGNKVVTLAKEVGPSQPRVSRIRYFWTTLQPRISNINFTRSVGTRSTMSFAIEVPGEAAPLTPQQVYLALQSASSSQQLSIQTGTQQLQTWETQRGYYPLLQVCYFPKFPQMNGSSQILYRQSTSTRPYPLKSDT